MKVGARTTGTDKRYLVREEDVLENVKRDDWMLVAVALLLVIDLLVLPWFDVSIGPISVTSTATGTPDGWLGVLAVLAACAWIADLGLERLASQTRVPAIAGSRTMTRLALAEPARYSWRSSSCSTSISACSDLGSGAPSC